jgi:hypothetical protein
LAISSYRREAEIEGELEAEIEAEIERKVGAIGKIERKGESRGWILTCEL